MGAIGGVGAMGCCLLGKVEADRKVPLELPGTGPAGAPGPPSWAPLSRDILWSISEYLEKKEEARACHSLWKSSGYLNALVREQGYLAGKTKAVKSSSSSSFVY